MYKNYISVVRQSLYDKGQIRGEANTNGTAIHKDKQLKTMKFEEYKSENVFVLDQLKPFKSKNKPNHRIDKEKVIQQLSETGSQKFLLGKKERHKIRKRKKLESSSSSSNDLVPSKSELREDIPVHKHVKIKKLDRSKNVSKNKSNGLKMFNKLSLSSESNSDISMKLVKKMGKRITTSTCGSTYESTNSSIPESSEPKYTMANMDTESLTNNDSDDSFVFTCQGLFDKSDNIPDIPANIPEKNSKIKKEISKISSLDDSDESHEAFSFEKVSEGASFSEMPINNIDFGCRFITKKLKNVTIESGIICDELIVKNFRTEEEVCDAINTDTVSQGHYLEKQGIRRNNKSKVMPDALQSSIQRQDSHRNDEPQKVSHANMSFMEEQDIFGNKSDADMSCNGTFEDVNETGNVELDSTDYTQPVANTECDKNYIQKTTNTKYISVNSKRVVVLKYGESIPVFGVFTLKVLYGKLEVLGYILDRNSAEINIYSPRGSALLYLKNASLGLEEVQEETGKTQYVLDKTDTVVECCNFKDIRISFIERHISQQIFPKIYGRDPRVIFEPKENLPVVTIDDSWNTVIDSVKSTTKLMITGGKGVGKSTFLRYAINRLLNTYKKIRVIDLDTGQSEFAVPGCISVLTITEPVLGPHYTHLKKTERSYLSSINIGQDPRLYIKCIQLLVEYVDTLEHIPTLINYMGFVKGMGLNIISSAISFINPTDIVQINSSKRKNNFIVDLSVATVKQNCDLFGCGELDFEFDVHILNAMNDRNDGWKLEPRQMRELCTFAYLGDMMSEHATSLTSHTLPMWKIALSSIKIVDIQGKSLPPSAINANLVALCNKYHVDDSIFGCLGFGVVRGIDLNENYLVLMTPEDTTILEAVEYLVLSSVLLPPSLYMSPNDVAGNIPYVMNGELVSLAQITKRSYLPVNKK